MHIYRKLYAPAVAQKITGAMCEVPADARRGLRTPPMLTLAETALWCV